jgi:CHAD domain-containing protein
MSRTRGLQHRRKASTADSQDRDQLEPLLRERLRKFTALLLKVLAGDSDEAVHDLRVWSRRLQQVVTTVSSRPLPPQARTMVRALRRARRSVGGWRECDVLIDLLERKARRIRNPEEKKVCGMIRDLALNKRKREIRRARRRLASRKIFTLGQRAERFLDELAQGKRQDAARILATSISDGHAHWRKALSLACDDPVPAKIHAFRIRTKQLRYRIELARDRGERDAKPVLGFLRSLQDELGGWHDRAQLFRLTAEALADPELLLKHAGLIATLLHKADREHAVQAERIGRLLTITGESVGISALDHWVAHYCRTTPFKPPAAPERTAAQEACPNVLALNADDRAAAPESAQGSEVSEVQVLEAEPGKIEDVLPQPAEPVEDFIKATGDLPS